MPLKRIDPVGGSFQAAVTEDCVVLTVIDWGPKGQPGPMGSVNRYEPKEHDSFVDALTWLRENLDCYSGDWDRIFIVNPERTT